MRSFLAKVFPYLLCLCLLFTGCGGEDSAVTGDQPVTGDFLEAETLLKGDLRCLYLCDPGGNINTNPCNPPAGNGLLPIARVLELERARGESFLFFLTGDLLSHHRKERGLYKTLFRAYEVAFLPNLFETMKPTAMLPGLNDLSLLGIPGFLEQLKNVRDLVICANLVEGEEQTPVFTPYRMLEAGGIKIGLTGLMCQKITLAEEESGETPKIHERVPDNVTVAAYLGEEGYDVLDPVATAASMATRLKGEGAQFIILLSHLTHKRNRLILESTPVDLVVGNSIAQKNNYTSVPGGITVTTKGAAQVLGRIDLHFSGQPADLLGDKRLLENSIEKQAAYLKEMDRLTEKYGTKDPAKLLLRAEKTNDGTLFKTYEAWLKEAPAEIAELEEACEGSYFHNYYIRPLGFVSEHQGEPGKLWKRYTDELHTFTTGQEDAIKQRVSARKKDTDAWMADPVSCRACHPAQYDHWNGTKHAKAYQVVLNANCGYHPACVSCHSTGYRFKNGYVLPPAPKKFQAVTCDVCHGILKDHVNDFLAPLSHRDLMMDPEQLAALCTFCHERKRSPEFSLPIFLPRITCPPLNPALPELQTLYLERNEAFDAMLKEKKVLETPELYMRAAVCKNRLTGSEESLIDLLYQGYEQYPLYYPLVASLGNALEKANRHKESLKILEAYVEKKQREKRANRKIIRLLLFSPDPEVRDLEGAKSYIEWFDTYIAKNDLEIMALNAVAEMQLGHYDASAEILDRLEERNPPPPIQAEIDRMRVELKKKGK